MKILFLLFFSISVLFSKELDKVSIQLQWLDQFQFAGYYIAKEKGFYKEQGLEVDIKKYDFGIMPIDEVVENRATFGVGRSSLAIDRADGKDIVVLSAIFQTSPLVLLGTKSSGIKNLNDVAGKKIMATRDAKTTASIRAMFKSYGLSQEDINIIPHSFDIQDLIDGKTDLMASYISNEPYLLEQKGIEYIMFDPKNYGFDFYSDFLFTSKKIVDENPNMVEKFRKATIKGWSYAFENISESVDIIFDKYNPQNKTKNMLTYEAKALKKLAYYGVGELGDISTQKMRRTVDIFRVLGVMKKDIDLKEFIYKPIKKLTKIQKEYLDSKEDIKVCIDPFWKPLEFIEDGKYKGMIADFISEFSKIINKEISLVKTNSWEQSLAYVKSRKCDMLSAAASSKDRKVYLDFTSSYLSFPNVIVTHLNSPYIYDLNLFKEKKVGMVKGYSYVQDLKKRYPNMQIVEFHNLEDGLEALNKKKIYAFIDLAATIGHEIREKNYINLKISGQLKEPLDLKIATRDDEPILNEIMQYSIDNMGKDIENKILNKWQTINVEEKIDYAFIWKMVIFFFVLFILFLYLILKLKKSKELAEESLHNMEKVLDTTIEGICVIDRNYNIIIVNKSALNIFGYTNEEFLKLNLLDIVAPSSKETVRKNLLNPNIRGYEIELIKKDGTIFPGSVSGKDIVYKGEKARISTFIDLSSLKKAQEDLKKLNNDLEKRIEDEVEKNLKKEKLLFQQSRQAQMGEMISMIAHQWRQPLSTISLTMIAIKLKIDLKKFDFDSKEGINEFILYLRKQFDDVLSTVNNLSSIIDDFRVFYKPDKKPVVLNVNDVIKKSLNMVGISLEQDNIKIIEKLDCKCEVEIYDNELMQVFLNIFKNTQDNFRLKDIKDKKLTIKTYCGVSNLFIEIIDNGGGIDQEVLAKIFDPYFSTKDEKNGTGLGLYMSKIIIEEHHQGKLYAKNTDDGVKFTIDLKR